MVYITRNSTLIYFKLKEVQIGKHYIYKYISDKLYSAIFYISCIIYIW